MDDAPSADDATPVYGAPFGDAPSTDDAPSVGDTPPLFDMHCHFDFADDSERAAHDAARNGWGMLSCTVDPHAFQAQQARFASCKTLRVGLGMHPWWVDDGRVGKAGVELFERLAPEASYIGEIGLDLAPRHLASADRQTDAFRRAIAACMVPRSSHRELLPKVISIHAVRAADQVLDILEEYGAPHVHACILHWFSGSSQQLTRALKAGCYISLGEHSMRTKRGRAYARAIPANRLLLETDLPGEPGVDYGTDDTAALVPGTAHFDTDAWRSSLIRAAQGIAEARGIEGAAAHDLFAQIAATSQGLLGL